MVEQLWRYLVKSAQGESLASLTFDSAGPRLDRSWACLDADGIVVSAKHPRRWVRLLQVRAWSPDGERVLGRPGRRTRRADAQVPAEPRAQPAGTGNRRPGRAVRGVALEVTLPTPRCAIPGLAQPGLHASSDLLRAVGRRRQDIPGFGTAACLGVYAEVVRPGVVTCGELAVVA